MILYRPVGEKELQLIKNAGFSSFPPRLPEQPIFYPVLNPEYAREIASKWNVEDRNSDYTGYVLKFEVMDDFIAKYEAHIVGSAYHKEYWIPAEDLDAFNSAIIGNISVLETYSKK